MRSPLNSRVPFALCPRRRSRSPSHLAELQLIIAFEDQRQAIDVSEAAVRRAGSASMLKAIDEGRRYVVLDLSDSAVQPRPCLAEFLRVLMGRADLLELSLAAESLDLVSVLHLKRLYWQHSPWKSLEPFFPLDARTVSLTVPYSASLSARDANKWLLEALWEASMSRHYLSTSFLPRWEWVEWLEGGVDFLIGDFGAVDIKYKPDEYLRGDLAQTNAGLASLEWDPSRRGDVSHPFPSTLYEYHNRDHVDARPLFTPSPRSAWGYVTRHLKLRYRRELNAAERAELVRLDPYDRRREDRFLLGLVGLLPLELRRLTLSITTSQRTLQIERQRPFSRQSEIVRGSVWLPREDALSDPWVATLEIETLSIGASDPLYPRKTFEFTERNAVILQLSLSGGEVQFRRLGGALLFSVSARSTATEAFRLARESLKESLSSGDVVFVFPAGRTLRESDPEANEELSRSFY